MLTVIYGTSDTSILLLPPAARGAFLKNRPPGPPEKLFIALRAVGLPPSIQHSERKKRYFSLLLVFFLMAITLPAVEPEEYLLMKPIQDSLNTGDFNHLKNHSENKVSINFDPPFELKGYLYIDKIIEECNRKFEQYKTNKIQWISAYLEEKFAVQSLNLILKNKRSEKTVYYKIIFFLKKVKITARTEEIKEWKIYYLRGLRI
jgi:hypothetical protein